MAPALFVPRKKHGGGGSEALQRSLGLAGGSLDVTTRNPTFDALEVHDVERRKLAALTTVTAVRTAPRDCCPQHRQPSAAKRHFAPQWSRDHGNPDVGRIGRASSAKPHNRAASRI